MEQLLIGYSGDHRFICDMKPAFRGGQADIFPAWGEEDDSEEPVYAVKMERHAGGEDSWLEHEVAELTRLHAQHPDAAAHLVEIIDDGEHEGRRFIVMPWYPLTLTRWQERRSLEERLHVLTLLADSVVHLQIDENSGSYRREVVHRDIKPDNVFVVDEGENIRVLLGDFGSVKNRHGYTSGFNTGYHTEGYSPIDQILPKEIPPDPSWDTYALGCTVFEILSGLPPQGVTRSYTQITDEGRALKRHSQTYRSRPSDGLYNQILTLSRRSLPELVRLSEINPLLPEDIADLNHELCAHLTGRVRYPEALADELTAELEATLRGALAPNPQDRPESARDLRDRLRSLHGRVLRALAGEETPPPSPWKKWLAGGVGIGLIVVLAAALWPAGATVSLTLADAPDWGETGVRLIRQDGSGMLAASIGPAGSFVVEDVPPGRWLVEIAGGTPDGRCRWREEHDLSVRSGPLTHARHLLTTPPPCPTEAHSYTFVEVPAGTFQMGRHPDEEGFDTDEPPQREVPIAGFQMGRLEVSQALWQEVMGSNPMQTQRIGPPGSTQASCGKYLSFPLVDAELPVACVTWCEAIAFANRLSEVEGLQPVYQDLDACSTGGTAWIRSADGYRLPTEAEWEYAARAGASHPQYAGLPYSAATSQHRAVIDRRICTYANVADQSFAQDRGEGVFPCNDRYPGLAPVGSFAENAWSLHDMTGNVSEWVWDRYDALPSLLHVTRGGSFDTDERTARIANRGANPPDVRSLVIGLRLARTPEG